MLKSVSSLQEIKRRLEQTGDLPIFSESVNRIQLLSDDPESDVMQLAAAVMKDANLSIKLLTLANSAYYNRGSGRIGSVVQAVMLLGYETVRNVCLTLKLIDTFSADEESLQLSGMLVQSFITASFMRELALKAGVKDAEQSYLCGLLHNLGEILVAHALPDQYLEAQYLFQSTDKDWTRVQQDVLETTFAEIGQGMAQEWGFPSSIANSLGMAPTREVRPAASAAQFNQQLGGHVAAMVANLYRQRLRTKRPMAELCSEAAKICGLEPQQVTVALDSAFQAACELAHSYGIDKRILAPKVAQTGDDWRDKLSSQYAYFVHNFAAGRPMKPRSSVEAVATAIAEEAAPARGAADPQLLLKCIHGLTAIMGRKADLNVVIMKMLEGVTLAAGFDRAVLCLLNPARDQYQARLAMGEKAEPLKAYFSFPLDIEHDLFSQVIAHSQQQWVKNLADPVWLARLPPDFQARCGVTSFVLSSFGIEGKPWGLVYADMGATGSKIGLDQYQGFCQIISHARLALRVR